MDYLALLEEVEHRGNLAVLEPLDSLYLVDQENLEMMGYPDNRDSLVPGVTLVT